MQISNWSLAVLSLALCEDCEAVSPSEIGNVLSNCPENCAMDIRCGSRGEVKRNLEACSKIYRVSAADLSQCRPSRIEGICVKIKECDQYEIGPNGGLSLFPTSQFSGLSR